MGTLRIHGTIDIAQFWPVSSSDADTTKIKLYVNKNSFEYKEEGDSKFSKTTVFEGAVSKGQGSKEVINTRKKDGIRTITVRLQGVDAPELHYRAAPLKRTSDVSEGERKKFNEINEERRQPFAESATVALANHLKKYADKNGLIKGTFETNIEFPYQAVDTYGRFVGNIRIGKAHDINLWLVENGWGQPAFYSSMSHEEIKGFLNAWEKGKKKTGRTASATSLDAGKFDWKLLYRRPPVEDKFNIDDDKGKVLMPKIFRRQVAWMVSKKAGVLSSKANLQTYLKKSPDKVMLLNDFLNNDVHSAEPYDLHKFINVDNKVLKGADELVFKEKPGTLLDTKGKKITKWK